MSANLASLLYIAAGVFFILALRGLSQPETARTSNYLGMTGMATAIIATLFLSVPENAATWLMILGGLSLGALLGSYTAAKVSLEGLPRLVAGLHSLVGLSAVFVAASALHAPGVFGIEPSASFTGANLFEMALGALIGAFTFTGSLVAFVKLNPHISNAGVTLPARHLLPVALCAILFLLVWWFCHSGISMLFWVIAGAAFLLGILITIPVRGTDMPVVVSMMNSLSGWAAAGLGFEIGNLALIIVGALVGASGAVVCRNMCDERNQHLISILFGTSERNDDTATNPNDPVAPANWDLHNSPHSP